MIISGVAVGPRTSFILQNPTVLVAFYTQSCFEKFSMQSHVYCGCPDQSNLRKWNRWPFSALACSTTHTSTDKQPVCPFYSPEKWTDCQEQDRLSLLPLRKKNLYLPQRVKRNVQLGWICSCIWLEWLGLNRIPEVDTVNSGKSRDFVIQNICSCPLRKATRDGLVLHRWESQGSLHFEVTITVLVGTSIFLPYLTLQSCS